MKPLLLILLTAVSACTAVQKAPRPVYLTVTHVQRDDQYATVYAVRAYMKFRADNCLNLADSVKRGSRVMAVKSDSCKCNCYFKRINQP